MSEKLDAVFVQDPMTGRSKLWCRQCLRDCRSTVIINGDSPSAPSRASKCSQCRKPLEVINA